jgi:hypothetical protein
MKRIKGKQDVCTHTDCIHPIPVDVFVRLVLSPIQRVFDSS